MFNAGRVRLTKKLLNKTKQKNKKLKLKYLNKRKGGKKWKNITEHHMCKTDSQPCKEEEEEENKNLNNNNNKTHTKTK